MTHERIGFARDRAAAMLQSAGIVLTPEERASIEIAAFGLDDFEKQGLSIVVYANTDRYCGKELILFPRQSCPQHRHPQVRLTDGRVDPGKMETFRCRRGVVYLYLEGPAKARPGCQAPAESADHYTVWNEIVLRPGEQFTIPPDTLHWFQAGPDGAIVTEFSSTSRDELDYFSDPRIRRVDVDPVE